MLFNSIFALEIFKFEITKIYIPVPDYIFAGMSDYVSVKYASLFY